MGIPQFDLLPVPFQTSVVKGQSKGNHTTTVVCKHTKFIMQGGKSLDLQGRSSPDLTAFLYMPLDTPLLHILCRHLLQPSHRRASWRLLTNFLHLMHRVFSFFLHSLEIEYYMTKDYNGENPTDLTGK